MSRLRKLEWLKDRMDYRESKCLIWPFGRVNDGYGQLSVGNNKIRKAHRVMCELVNGPAPTGRHEAAHSCGNGHLGCVNPRHLSWKTPVENRQDSKLHGTHHGRRGIRELKPSQVLEIRGSKRSHAELAAIYGRTRRTIDRIIKRELWPDHSKSWR